MKRLSRRQDSTSAGSAARPGMQDVERKHRRREQQESKPPDATSAGSAERPAEPQLKATVVYISFPVETMARGEQRRSAIEAVRQAKEADADVINIAFARDADVPVIEEDIKKVCAERPAFLYRTQGPLITLFSDNCGEPVREENIDPEGGVPSICLTFNGRAGRMIVINAHWPPLPTGTKARMLKSYLNPALETKNSIRLIGGELGPSMFLEHHLQKKAPDYQFSVGGDVCVLTKTVGHVSKVDGEGGGTVLSCLACLTELSCQFS